MKVILTEEQVKRILEQKSTAQIVQGDKGDPYEYKKEGGYYYARKKELKIGFLLVGMPQQQLHKNLQQYHYQNLTL